MAKLKLLSAIIATLILQFSFVTKVDARVFIYTNNTKFVLTVQAGSQSPQQYGNVYCVPVNYQNSQCSPSCINKQNYFQIPQNGVCSIQYTSSGGTTQGSLMLWFGSFSCALQYTGVGDTQISSNGPCYSSVQINNPGDGSITVDQP